MKIYYENYFFRSNKNSNRFKFFGRGCRKKVFSWLWNVPRKCWRRSYWTPSSRAVISMQLSSILWSTGSTVISVTASEGCWMPMISISFRQTAGARQSSNIFRNMRENSNISWSRRDQTPWTSTSPVTWWWSCRIPPAKRRWSSVRSTLLRGSTTTEAIRRLSPGRSSRRIWSVQTSWMRWQWSSTSIIWRETADPRKTTGATVTTSVGWVPVPLLTLSLCF